MTSINTNLSERLIQGRQLARTKHKEKEVAALGNLRAGNSGIMSPEGEITGSCHRLTHLRQLGIDVEEPTDSKLIMFQMGIANETVVYDDLVHTKAEDEVILREEEIPIEWFTSNGTKVTGRPDMVICRVDPTGSLALRTSSTGEVTRGSSVYGIEIKSIASVWTTREVLFEDQPKLEHLIQAGHYSWKLDIPFRLMYKQYSNQVVPGWASKMFPRVGEKHSEHIDYNDKGDIKAIQPFEIVYELEFTKAGILRYRREGTSKWTNSLVNRKDIHRYYEYASNMRISKDIGPIPMTLDARGKKKGYSRCGYCSLQPICSNKKVRDYDVWLEQVRSLLSELNLNSKQQTK